MKQLFRNHPILTGIVATIVVFFAAQIASVPFTIAGIALTYGNDSLEDSMGFLAAAIGAYLVLLIFATIYKKKGFNGTFVFAKNNLKDVYIGLLLVVAVDIACLIFAASRLDGGMNALVLPSLYTFSLALASGVAEETIFRAIPAALMMKNQADDRRIIVTVVFTSLMFGLMHLSNMTQGAIFSTTMIQVAGATTVGILYAAIYLRSGSILLPMLDHFFHDLINFMIPAQATGIMTQTSYSSAELLPEFAMVAAELSVGIYLLRKVNFEEIKNTWKQKWSE